MKCLWCQSVLEMTPQRKSRLKHANGTLKGQFCSTKCVALHKNALEFPEKQFTVNCGMCSKAIRRSGFQLRKSRTGVFFCSVECKHEWQRENPPHWVNGNASYRRRALKYYGAVCQICGYDEHPGAIVAHHLNENREDNRLENLRVLCKNCHALVHLGVKTIGEESYEG